MYQRTGVGPPCGCDQLVPEHLRTKELELTGSDVKFVKFVSFCLLFKLKFCFKFEMHCEIFPW